MSASSFEKIAQVFGSFDVRSKTPEEQAAAIINLKQWQIVLPKVRLHDAPLALVAEYLQRESATLDKHPDLLSPGVSIRLEEPADSQRSAVQRWAMSSALINVSGDDVPLRMVLEAVAYQANMDVATDPQGVLLRFQQLPSTGIATREFRVPPEFVALFQSYDPPSEAGMVNGVAVYSHLSKPLVYLESQGIHFGDGTAAVYLANTSKLVVRSTPENLLLVQTLVNRAWNRSASPRPSVQL